MTLLLCKDHGSTVTSYQGNLQAITVFERPHCQICWHREFVRRSSFPASHHSVRQVKIMSFKLSSGMHPAPCRCRMQGSRAVARHSTALVTRAVATDKAQPDWTGESLLSGVVNWMINTKPIFAMMKLGAKNAMKSTTQKAGIDWDGHVRNMQQISELQQLAREFEQQPDSGLQYPSYYTVPFHSYDDGNLCWQAAYEVEPASYAMALRTFKTEQLTGEQAMTKLRGGINSRIQEYLSQHDIPAPSALLDVGCSTGISSRWYQQAFPAADITGLDLSPFFLACAELEERRRAAAGETSKRIKFMRGLAEATGFQPGSFDMVVFSFIAHECPQQALQDFVAEACRILNPGGVICFVDNNPRSKTIQNLPPVLFTLMKSTEPWSDEYYSFDLEAAMRDNGFTDVVTTEADHRHRTVFGTKE